MYTKNCMLASSKPIHCFSPLSRKLDVGRPRIEDFQLRGHSCVNNVQRCLCHFYTWMRHSKQTATLLLTKRHANFDTSTSAKGYARVCTNCACAIVVLGILLAQARPTMPCIRLVLCICCYTKWMQARSACPWYKNHHGDWYHHSNTIS